MCMCMCMCACTCIVIRQLHTSASVPILAQCSGLLACPVKAVGFELKRERNLESEVRGLLPACSPRLETLTSRGELSSTVKALTRFIAWMADLEPRCS